MADRQAGFSVGTECGWVDEFFLQCREKRFRWGVVPTHPGSTHRLGDAVADAQVAVVTGRVLTGFNWWSQHWLVLRSAGVR